MSLNIAICDDDSNICNLLHNIITTFQFQNNIDFHVHTFQSGNALLNKCKTDESFHVIFLDIELSDSNGLEIAKQIRKSNRYVKIIFVSSHPEYSISSFSVHPYYFVTKPFTNEAVMKLLSEVLYDIQASKLLYTIIDTSGGQQSVNLHDVIYLFTIDSKKEIIGFSLGKKKINAKGTIKSWNQKLCSYGFTICYQGYLINLAHIHYITSDQVIMDTMEQLPLKRSLRSEIQKLYLNQVNYFDESRKGEL